MAKKPKQPMRVIALAASKGGVGKSTLTASLAVRASQDSARVALIDCDPQLSLASWYDRRGAPKNPQLFDDIDSNTEAIELIASEGWEFLFIDTPPSQIDRIEAAIVCADLVLIPLKPSYYDLEAIGITEELCEQHHKPCAYVLNMTPETLDKPTKATIAALNKRGTLLTPYISLRPSHVAAAFKGQTAAEQRDATARKEIDALWKAVKAELEGAKVRA